jgi:hypothetical protein
MICPSALLEVIEGEFYTQKLSQEKTLYLMLLYEYSIISQIVQAVSRRFLTAAAWVQSQATLCVIHGRQSGSGAGFLRVPLPVIPQNYIFFTPITRGWYKGQISRVLVSLSFKNNRNKK